MNNDNLPVISHHLDSALRNMQEKGVTEVEHDDIKDLVLFGYVSLKFKGGWVLSEQGKYYLKKHPYAS